MTPSGNISPRWSSGAVIIHWIYLLCGVCLGFLSSSFLSLYSSSNIPSVEPILTKSSQSRTETLYQDGWSNVHVFTGHDSNTTYHHMIQAARIKPNLATRRWFSQSRQDEFVSQFLRHKRNGYFVDLAANNAIRISNTFALEHYQNWKGLCIEANPEYWNGLAYRRNCITVAAVVGRQMLEHVSFKFPNRAGPKGGIVGEQFDNSEPSQFEEDQPRYTVTLEHILDRFHAPSVIDYLSLDVEGAETFVMESFPFDRYRIRIMTIERPDESLSQLLTTNGYELLVTLKKKLGETVWVHKELLNAEISQVDLSVLYMETETYRYSEKEE